MVHNKYTEEEEEDSEESTEESTKDDEDDEDRDDEESDDGKLEIPCLWREIVIGSNWRCWNCNNEEEHSEDDEDEEDFDKEEDSDDVEVFDDEPERPSIANIGNNSMQDRGHRDDSDRKPVADSSKFRMAVLIMCCCVMVLAVVGVILGVVVFKDDDAKPEATAAVGPTSAPVVPTTPTFAPFVSPPSAKNPGTPQPTVAPTMTDAAPSEPIPEDVVIRPGADTYITSGVVNHGAEDTLLVQNDAGGNEAAIALVSFDIENITSLPESLLDDRVETATAIFTLKPDVVNVTTRSKTSMIQLSRLPSTTVLIEGLGSESFEQPANKVDGNIFEVPSNATTVTVDVTDLLFGQAPFIILRRLATQEQQLLLMLENRGTSEAQSIQFYSRESDFSPQLVIGLKKKTESPTVLPSVSTKPSLRPSISFAPSLSTKPSLRPSTAPSAKPSLSQNPSDSPTTSAAPSVSAKPTALSDVPSNSTLPPNVNMTMPPTPPGNGTDTTNMTMTPTDANMTMARGNGTDSFICNICGEGNIIGDPDGVIMVPSQDSRTCNEFQLGGDSGLIGESECAGIQAFNTLCGCEIAV
jgi:hypothetical protein